MQFLFATIICISSFSFAQDTDVTVGTPDTASMRIGEATSGSNTAGNPIVTGIACDACETHATNQPLNAVDLNFGAATPATTGSGTPAGNNIDSSGASQE